VVALVALVASLLCQISACAPRAAHRAVVNADSGAAGEVGADAGSAGAGGANSVDGSAGVGGGEPDAAPDAPASLDLAADLPAPDLAADASPVPDGLAGSPVDLALELGLDGPAGVDLSAGLVHHWKLDEGIANVTADSSGTGNSGTLMGGPTWVSPGAFPGSPFALSFDGTSAFVATVSDLAPVLGGTASLSCWIKTTQKGADNSFDAPGITGVEMGGGSNDIFWGFLDAGGNLGLRPGAGSTVKSAAPINDNLWHHVVMTRDATSRRLQIFIDGKLSKAADGQEAGPKSTMFAAIGRITNSSKPYFKGQLDDVRIWNRVISPVEVTALFAGN
jgi:hypothetical protein